MAGNQYYVDNLKGNNANDGLTPDTPWRSLERVHVQKYKPGDSLYFKRGGHWNGMFFPSGSGAEEAPITVDAYGDGDKPLIDGAGAEAAILVKGLDYWTIRNIKCMNQADERTVRCGIKIMGRPSGVTRGIHIENCEVTEVTGENRRSMPFYKSMYWNSGIYVSIPGRSTQTDHLENVVIEKNYVHDVLTSGIRVNQDEDVKNDCFHVGVVVRGNTIRRTGSDAIIVANCDSPLIEYNRCYDAGALGSKKDTFLIAGVWVCATRNALIQYNEVARTRLFDNDGTAFDTDWGTAGTTTFQFNYSHENEGGFWLDCTGLNYNEACKGTILKGNVSVNDQRCIVQADMGIDTLFEKNIFINTTEITPAICVQADGKSHHYINNTFDFKSEPADGWQASRYDSNKYAEGLSNPSDLNPLPAVEIQINTDTLDGKEKLFGLSFKEKEIDESDLV